MKVKERKGVEGFFGFIVCDFVFIAFCWMIKIEFEIELRMKEFLLEMVWLTIHQKDDEQKSSKTQRGFRIRTE